MRLGSVTALLFIFHVQHVFHCSSAVVPGYLDFDNLPDTNFSCEGKVIGGYYADIETGCQMFHVCTIGQKGETTDIKFLCLNGTVFDQETRVCERVDEVDCSKTEGFYDLNLELYGNSAALSFPEEEAEEEVEAASEKNTEASDTSSDSPGLKHKTSTSKASTAPPLIATPIVPYPTSTTTTKPPVHPFVPTTTFKPSQHLTHFHSTTPSSVAAFLAINNAFSSSSTNQDGNKFGDDSNQYDEDEEGEEEEEEEDIVTRHPGIVINGGMSHHFPVTTVSSQVRPVSPEHHNIPQPNVKVHGTGESGLILNQSNKHQPQKAQSPLTHSAHVYEHDYRQTPHAVKDESAHSKHQLNTQFILNQQRDNENKQHHGFKPISNTEGRNQFLFSSTTQQPPIFFTTKSPTAYHAPTIETFSLHAIGSQPAIQTTQRSPTNSPFPPQTNAHQVPPNNIAQQTHASIANNGGFLAQTIQISENPLTFHFNPKSKNRQGHQFFTTPSVAVITTTSSSSSSSSVRSGPTGKAGNISPVIPLTSSTRSTPRGSSIPINSSVPLFSETTPPNSYDEYQESDVASDPFFRDVPKISKPSTMINIPSPTRYGIIRNKREVFTKYGKLRLIFPEPHNTARYRRKAVAQFGLPMEVFGTGEVRHKNKPEGPTRGQNDERSHQNNSWGQIRVESQYRRTSTPEERVPKETSVLPKPSPFVAVAQEVSMVIPEVLQQPTQYSSTHYDIRLLNSSQKHSENSTLDSPVRTNNHQGHQRTVVRVRRPQKQDVKADMDNLHPSQLPHLSDHTESLRQFRGNSRPNAKSVEAPIKSVDVIARTSESVQTSHDIPKAGVKLHAGNSQTSQDSTKYDPTARQNSRGGDRQLHQSSKSNLDPEKVVESKSGRSRQRNRQRIRMGAAENAHNNREHRERILLNSQLRDNTSPVKSASIRTDNRHSNSENIEEKTTYHHHTEAPSKIRSRGREFSVSNTYQDVGSLDGSRLVSQSNDSDEESVVTTESPSEPVASLPETSFTCADKIPGGYYADLEADCQLFHICSVGRHGRIADNKFLCGPGTRFNQRSRTCQVRGMVDCKLSASLYHLNSHFKLESPADVSKYNVDFEAHKIRMRRKAPNAASQTERGLRQQYSIDNIPQTSFTCEDKPQDGLYADVETQCQVFHLCRTVSGQLTLESSFVCPPGTVFSQPEGNCDTWKEVDCALYSEPEHSFKKTAATGIRSQGSKDRNKRHAIIKGARTESLKEIMYRLGVHKNYRLKRGTEEETFDYYDYVDDNYEAHAAKPVNRGSDQTEKLKENFSNVEESAYDDNLAAVSTEKHAKPEPYLFKSEENGKVGQQAIASHGNIDTDSNRRNKAPKPYESFLPYAVGTLVPTGFHSKEAKITTEQIASDVLPDQLHMHSKSDEGEVEDTSDYVYEYEYVDEDITATSVTRNITHTDSTSEEDNKTLTNYTESNNLEPRHDAQISDQSVTVGTNDYVKNSSKIVDLNQSLVDTLTFSASMPENILNETKDDKVINETKILPKLDSADVTSDDYEYEYYYDDGYTEAKSNSKQFSSASGHKMTTNSEKQSDDSAHNLHAKEIKQQIHQPALVAQESVNDTHKNSNFEGCMKVSEMLKPPTTFEASAKIQMHFGTDITSHDTQKSSFIQADRISKLSETNKNPSLMQEIDMTIDGTAVQNHRNLYENNDGEGGGDIKLASYTTHLHKEPSDSFGMVTTNSHLSLGEETTISNKLNSSAQNVQILDPISVSLEETSSLRSADYYTTIATTAESQKEGTSPAYSTTPHAEVTLYPQVWVPLSQSTPTIENKTPFTEDAVLDSTTQTSPSSTIPSLFRPQKLRNVFRNHYSTPFLPPVVIQSSNTLTSRKPMRQNQYRGSTDNVVNNIKQDEGSLRKSHRFTLPSNGNPVIHVPQQLHMGENNATTLTTPFVVDSPVIDDQDARSQNTVPNVQSSEMIRSEEMPSTAPHKEVNTFGVDYELETEIPLKFTKGSENTAMSKDKLMYLKNGALHSAPVSREAVVLSELQTFSPTENSVSTFAPEYDNHNLPAINSSIIHTDDIMLNHFRPNNSFTDYAIRNNFKLTGQNSATSHVFPANDLTTPPSVFRLASGETTEVLPKSSPSLHAGYTFSSVNYQPSVSVGSILATGFLCTGRELHWYHADTNDCRIFHYCSPGFHDRQVLDFRFICENGTAFKAETQKCENELLVPTCVNVKVKN